MGKASKWFRALLGLNNSRNKKHTLAKSHNDNDDEDATKQAIAAASCCGVSQSGRRDECAAVTIQSHFRAYLSRRALRALKALVKFQALFRGHLVRKETVYALRRLQALVRAQVRARAGRALNYESPQSTTQSSHFNYLGPATPEIFENVIRARSVKHPHFMMLKRCSLKTSSSSIDHDLKNPEARRMLIDNNRTRRRLYENVSFPPTNNGKIVEIDTGTSKQKQPLFYSSRLSLPESASSCEVQSRFTEHEGESSIHSPTNYSVSSRGGCPSKSDGSKSYSSHPNYMDYTESSKAKTRRSLSAPKQRPHNLEPSRSAKRFSVYPGVGFSGHC